MIFGLGAALAWGVSDLGAAIIGRRIGSLATVLVAQVTSTVLFWVLLAVVSPAFHVDGGQLGLLLLNGTMASVGYLALYRGLAVGPVALVSPIVAAYGGFAVVLAMVLLDEQPSALSLTGAIITVVGVVLTAADVSKIGREKQGNGKGIALGLCAMVLFGLATLLLGGISREIGWMPTIAISRVVSSAVLVGVAAVRRPGLRAAGRIGLVGAILVGLADITGIGFYAYGTQVGLISIVAAVSATFTIIPVLGGVLMLRERPAPSQALGVVLVVTGLVLVGLGS